MEISYLKSAVVLSPTQKSNTEKPRGISNPVGTNRAFSDSVGTGARLLEP